MPSETLSICHSCGYGRPSNQTPIEYTEAYEAKYMNYPESDICKIRLQALAQTIKRYKNACMYPINPYTLLDYGCGSGAFVKAAKRSCYCAYGFDVNDFTADLRPPKNFKPDIVTAWDAFEHLTDTQQAEFFKTAENAKIIVVSVPDFTHALNTPDAFNSWRHYRPGEHLHYYTAIALTTRFEKEGFTLSYMSHSEDKVRKAPWKNNILTVGFIRG